MERNITLAHGSGGRLTAELVQEVFVKAFDDDAGRRLEDSAVLPPGSGEVALTTDGFVVKPRVFPGGDIGKLAVCGTVNDLAVAGAEPVALTVACIIEEGLAVSELRAVARSMAATARQAGVRIVAGDTKVVERGSGDGLYLATSGYGLLPPGRRLGAARLTVGDVILVSGDIGRHEAAILLARGELHFEAALESDCGLLLETCRGVLAAGGDGVRALRDCTRGGLATVLCEYAAASGLGLALQEAAIPVRPAVAAVCELLGLDPLYLACEGRLVAVVSEDVAERVEACLQTSESSAARIGQVVAEPAGRVVLETGIGGRRVLDLLAGGQLPRIC
ncbi:MAG: hydrogenase expression/formation protein HypE [Fimbriimonadaceae bacterium]|nr:hydrogenase expression/formation protein HypE [Fimbriimonadaceae bacterium]